MVKTKEQIRRAINRNRRISYQSRKKVEDRLTKQYGGTPSSRERARNFMKEKQVHHTGRGLELKTNRSEHGKDHGRGHKGPSGLYWKEK